MGMRRTARQHDTVAVRRQAAVSEDHAEHQQGDRVITVDGPGRVVAVHDGPFPGSEEYEIRLEGGLGGGTYDAGQITASAPVEASVGTSEATGIHLASDDYPELGSLLHDRPDPASLRYTAELASGGTPMSTHTSPAADGSVGDGDEGQVAWNPGEYNEAQYHGDDWRLAHQYTAMPSQKHPVPEGFGARIDRMSHGRHVLEGSLNGAPVGWLSYFAYGPTGEPLREDESHENVRMIRVQNLEVPGVHHRGKGVASAMMDHLYASHPAADIDHGDRTEDGRGWWDSYDDPDPSRNVTARSINGEEIDQHGSAPGWHRAANPNEYDRQSTEGEPDPAWVEDIREKQQAMASSLPSITAEVGAADLGRELDKFRDDQEERHQDDARFATNWEPLHKSDLKPEEHDGWMFMEHRSEPMYYGRPDPESKGNVYLDGFGTRPMNLTTYKHGITRKHLHLDEQGRSWKILGQVDKGGKLHDVLHRPGGSVGWSARQHLEDADHYKNLEQLGATPETKYNAEYQLQRNKRLQDAGFDVVSHKVFGPSPEDPDEIVRHLVDDHGYTHDQLQNLGDDGQGDELKREHELEHDASTSDDGVGGGEFGAGEQGGGTEHKHGPGYNKEFTGIPHLEHPIWGGAYNPTPGAAEKAVIEAVPAGVHPDDVPTHPWALSMLVTAAMDSSFRFHVTAGWRDVQAKAKRIRSQGGVSIKHSDGMTVVADVKGDHNVYETALQRSPGRRQSVAVYACGCKWGAYHWGASDDLSRFAGRMCSHALALQYEAASRGMFGRDVEVDDARPRWVPSKVVVKYDIDTGQSIRATAAVPEQPPLLVALASMQDDDPVARVITAAVNDMFGDTSGYSEPSLMSPMGPTVPWNKDENPTSAGPLSGGEPHNWGSITGPTMLPRIASLTTTEAFWQAIVPLVRAVAPKVLEKAAPALLGHEVREHEAAPSQETRIPDGTENGAQATLHDEPEGALPETDGEEHTASLGDVDIAESHALQDVADDAFSPENLTNIQTNGVAGIVADFQRSAAAKSLMDGGPQGGKSDSDIAQAAEAYLAKTAGSTFTRAEQDALIHESPGVQASNTDRLDIAGTHYAELQDMDDAGDDALWLM